MSLTDNCLDCDIDTIDAGEYYMVHKDVWSQTGLGSLDGLLCIGCLESRIGRLLNHKDFTNFPINKPGYFYASNRLISRRTKS